MLSGSKAFYCENCHLGHIIYAHLTKRTGFAKPKINSGNLPLEFFEQVLSFIQSHGHPLALLLRESQQ